MFENNKPAVLPDPLTDFTDRDTEQLNEYIASGLPAIATLSEDVVGRMFDLYLSGKTYRQISVLTKKPKSMVLYLSHRFNWFQERQEYLNDLDRSIKGRMMEFQVVNQDFLLQLVHVWRKRIGKKINKYFATDDESIIDSLDLKEIDKYLKTVEALQKMTSDGTQAPPKSPAVGINLGDGVTVTRKGENEVEITPKQRHIGDMLKQFADSKRKKDEDK